MPDVPDIALTRQQLASVIGADIEIINAWDKRGYFEWSEDGETKRKPGERRIYNLRKTWRAFVIKNLTDIGLNPGLASKVGALAEEYCPPGQQPNSVVGVIIRKTDTNFKLSTFRLETVELVTMNRSSQSIETASDGGGFIIYVNFHLAFAHLRKIIKGTKIKGKEILTNADFQAIYEAAASR